MFTVNIISKNQLEIDAITIVLKSYAFEVKPFESLKSFELSANYARSCILIGFSEMISEADGFFEKLQRLNQLVPIVVMIEGGQFKRLPENLLKIGISYLDRPVNRTELIGLLEIFRRSFDFK
ncbi:hypothetical protein ACO0KY_13075 [Undibacterium sp. Dicai25W]|uniref:hypothetical protein n=1 Tax=Undibacterium sp. Dicai25W TaxID=3413034 RepID=UPI003BF42E89